MTEKETVTISVEPTGGMDVLSQQEISQLKQTGEGGLHDLFTSCCLAVLNCGSHSDDPDEQSRRFSDFRVRVIQRDRGIKLELDNPPEDAFVDGQIIEGIREMLFDVLRDIGLQAGHRANIVVDAERQVVEVNYAPVTGG